MPGTRSRHLLITYNAQSLPPACPWTTRRCRGTPKTAPVEKWPNDAKQFVQALNFAADFKCHLHVRDATWLTVYGLVCLCDRRQSNGSREPSLAHAVGHLNTRRTQLHIFMENEEDDGAVGLLNKGNSASRGRDVLLRNVKVCALASFGTMCVALTVISVFLAAVVGPRVDTVSKDAAAMTQALRNRTDSYLAETDVLVFSMKNKGISDLAALVLQNAASILPADKQAKLIEALDDYLSMFAASATSARKNGLSLSINVPVGSSSTPTAGSP